MIRTKNLILLPCDLVHFAAILRNKSELAKLLEIKIPDNWTEFSQVIQYSYEHLKADPSLFGWWTYLFILKIKY